MEPPAVVGFLISEGNQRRTWRCWTLGVSSWYSVEQLARIRQDQFQHEANEWRKAGVAPSPQPPLRSSHPGTGTVGRRRWASLRVFGVRSRRRERG